MRRIFVSLLAAALPAALSCGTGPDGPDLTPSDLTVTFTGDSTKICGGSLQASGRSDETVSIQGRTDGQRAVCEITAEWTPCPDLGFYSYVLYRAESPGIASDPASATIIATVTNVDSTLFVDTSSGWARHYYYAVRTTNADEEGVWSNEASIVTPGTAPTPSVLSEAFSTWDLAGLDWTACPDQDFLVYRLFRSDVPDIAQDTTVAVLLETMTSVTDTTYADAGLDPGGTYYYAVLTLDGMGLGSWSNEIEVVLQEPFLDTVTATVAVSESPHGVAALPSGDYVYVACTGPDLVDVIRTSDNAVTASVPVGANPYELCALPTGGYVYVSCYTSGTVDVIRTSDNTVAGTVTVHPNPQGICALPSGDFVYVACDGGDLVDVIRTSDNTVVASVEVGSGPMGICALPSGEFVYVNCCFSDVYVIRTTDNTVFDIAYVDPYPARGIAAPPPGDYVFTACWGPDDIERIDTSDNSREGVVGVGSIPNCLCSTPEGYYVAAACAGPDSVYIIRAIDLALVGTVGVGADPYGICSLPGVYRLYVTNTEDATVSVIE
jgi:YVTN family beta-propeller protein